MKRRVTLILMAMVVALLMASGAALAADPTKEQATKESTTQSKSALGAPNVQAEKKHQNSINTVQCPNQSNDQTCRGTKGPDQLVGRDGRFDDIHGGKGDDIYDGKGGGDNWLDSGAKSNDYYLVSVENFGGDLLSLLIEDAGGSKDTLDLSRFYKSSDFAYSRFVADNNDLFMDGPGSNDVLIKHFFSKNTIDSFKFSDGTFTAQQIKQKVV